MFKFGLIGCGTISKAYGNAVDRIDHAVIDCVYDIDPNHSETFGRKYGSRTCSSWTELLASDVDAVCICLPSGLHVPYAIEAMRAGKNIVIEKPLGITLEQLDQIELVAEETGVKVGCISQLWFADGYQKTLHAVKSGRLGRVYLMEVSMKYYRTDEYFRTGGWRGTWAMDGGGALMNQGIHGVSLMLQMMGHVKSIRANVKTLAHDIEVEDTALAIVEFENGALGSIVGATSCAPGYDRRIAIHGEKGGIFLNEEKIERWDIPGDCEQPELADSRSTASDPSAFGNEMHRRQLVEFIDSVEHGRTPILSIAEGRAPVEVILGIYQASRTNQIVHLK